MDDILFSHGGVCDICAYYVDDGTTSGKFAGKGYCHLWDTETFASDACNEGFRLPNVPDKHFVELLDEVISAGEKEGLEKMFEMLLTLRQQFNLRSKMEGENE